MGEKRNMYTVSAKKYWWPNWFLILLLFSLATKPVKKPCNLQQQCKVPTLLPVLQNLQLQLIPPCQFLQIQRCSLFMGNHRLPQHLLNHGNYNWEINSYIKGYYYNLWKEVLFPQELFCEYFLGCFIFNYVADCLPFFVLPQLCLCYYCVYVIANNFDCTVLACHVFAFLLKIPVLKMSKKREFLLFKL